VAYALKAEVPPADVVRARVDAGLKNEASAVLREMGLSVSDAIGMMLARIAADRALRIENRCGAPKGLTCQRQNGEFWPGAVLPLSALSARKRTETVVMARITGAATPFQA
jgi:DNA-damage-inducible protein J